MKIWRPSGMFRTVFIYIRLWGHAVKQTDVSENGDVRVNIFLRRWIAKRPIILEAQRDIDT